MKINHNNYNSIKKKNNDQNNKLIPMEKIDSHFINSNPRLNRGEGKLFHYP